MDSNVMKFETVDGVGLLTFPAFTATGLVRHGFSTRIGGVSDGIYSSMNLSFTVGDSRENVLENYRRFCGAVGIDCHNLVFGYQVHSANVMVATYADRGKGIFAERDYDAVDAVITDEPGVAVCTLYADCTPIFFLDPVRRVVGMAHSGWRGTAAAIACRTVEKMAEAYGCDPKNILAGIGPSIGRCCYEVDEPVMEPMRALPGIALDTAVAARGNGKYMIDLKAVNRMLLISAGLSPDHISVSDLCTCCNSDTLHSHRASHGRRGSLAGVIELFPDIP